MQHFFSSSSSAPSLNVDHLWFYWCPPVWWRCRSHDCSASTPISASSSSFWTALGRRLLFLGAMLMMGCPTMTNLQCSETRWMTKMWNSWAYWQAEGNISPFFVSPARGSSQGQTACLDYCCGTRGTVEVIPMKWAQERPNVMNLVFLESFKQEDA